MKYIVFDRVEGIIFDRSRKQEAERLSAYLNHVIKTPACLKPCHNTWIVKHPHNKSYDFSKQYIESICAEFGLTPHTISMLCYSKEGNPVPIEHWRSLGVAELTPASSPDLYDYPGDYSGDYKTKGGDAK